LDSLHNHTGFATTQAPGRRRGAGGDPRSRAVCARRRQHPVCTILRNLGVHTVQLGFGLDDELSARRTNSRLTVQPRADENASCYKAGNSGACYNGLLKLY
jgi:hypothetical protein